MSCLDNTSVGNGHMTSSSTHADALFLLPLQHIFLTFFFSSLIYKQTSWGKAFVSLYLYSFVASFHTSAFFLSC
jgi:hypothetical protein